MRHRLDENQHFFFSLLHACRSILHTARGLRNVSLFHFTSATPNDRTETYYVIKIHKVYMASSNVRLPRKEGKSKREKIGSFSHKLLLPRAFCCCLLCKLYIAIRLRLHDSLFLLGLVSEIVKLG